MKKAFIFDMDGLLINSEPLWQATGIEVLNAHAIPVTLENMLQWTGSPVPVIVEKACALYQIKADQAVISEQFLAKAIDNIIKAKPIMPFVRETLNLLKAKGYRMAIASASPRYMLDAIVQSLDIADFFDVISSAHELEYNKPHPQVYLNACQQLGLKPKECVGVEDSKVGMTAVKSALMTCIVVPHSDVAHHGYWQLADYQLNHLGEITPEFLARL
ncbi:hexitol phosphatase HxpB [Caviibacterium pharyngocola]|uniref:Phosphatase n=1 Tax=Caviibacterium pharyngocola TaxID=28159 RepID=A0A2M8RUB4_9PAST|nr:hexitol phosphatase HxpB [Caviibacterium pharyngocola]PJG82480.1 phosphatase [Caviibacterium pharyngocola]